MKLTLTTHTLLTALLITSSSAAITTIIYDDFEGESLYYIGGSTTNTGQTWSGNPGTLPPDPNPTPGNPNLLAGVPQNSALHPSRTLSKITEDQQITSISGIGFLPNSIYTLSMEALVFVDQGADSTDWFGFGFTTPSFSHAVIGSVGTMLRRAEPAVQTFSSNSNSQQSIAVPAATGVEVLSINLTTGSTLADSTLTWELDGTQVGNSRSVNASQIDGVFFHGFEDALGLVDNYRLTQQAVPEPSSFLLSTLGTLTLILRRKR
ncbi:MAG: PEP-CTERM sorting domain-containing protein [Verrucomicrobiota bacterium]